MGLYYTIFRRAPGFLCLQYWFLWGKSSPQVPPLRFSCLTKSSFKVNYHYASLYTELVWITHILNDIVLEVLGHSYGGTLRLWNIRMEGLFLIQWAQLKCKLDKCNPRFNVPWLCFFKTFSTSLCKFAAFFV